MKILIKAICITLILPFSYLSVATPSYSSTAATPYINLVSVSSDPTNYPTTNRVSFQITIERIDNARYSDITRVWFCPSTNWDGTTCSAGQVIASAIPTATALTFSFVSSAIVLPDGEYLITNVTFRNGTTELGATLNYSRSGTVYIGTTESSISGVDISAADFWIGEIPITPDPETEEPAATPTESESTPDSTEETNSQENNTLDNQPGSADEPEPNSTSNESESTSTAAESTEQPSSAENSIVEEDPISEDPIVEENPITEDPIDEPTKEADDQIEQTTSTEQPESAANETSANSGTTTQPNSVNTTAGDDQPEIVLIQETYDKDSQPVTLIIQPTELVQVKLPIIENTGAQPQITEQISQQENKVQEQVVDQVELSPTTPKQVVTRIKDAQGSKVTKFAGISALTRKITAGTGRIRLMKSLNGGIVTIKLGNKTLYQVNLAGKDKFVSLAWQSAGKATLKILPNSIAQEVVIDSITLNQKLIANPTFQMRP